MLNKWGKNSLNKINAVGLDIVIKEFLLFAEDKLPNCTITCTIRTLEEQQECFKNKTSKLDGVIKKSKHQVGKAFDIVPYPNLWKAKETEWKELNVSIKKSLELFNVEKNKNLKLQWGGDWKNFIDKPHYEIIS